MEENKSEIYTYGWELEIRYFKFLLILLALTIQLLKLSYLSSEYTAAQTIQRPS